MHTNTLYICENRNISIYFNHSQTPKKSQFTLKRKKNTKPIDEWSDLVCPFGSSGEQEQNCSSNSTINNNPTNVSLTKKRFQV